MLSERDRAELRGLGQGQVSAVVEAIVARHVAAALNEAADAIEAEGTAVFEAADHTTLGVMAAIDSGYQRAARIVRTAADTP